MTLTQRAEIRIEPIMVAEVYKTGIQALSTLRDLDHICSMAERYPEHIFFFVSLDTPDFYGVYHDPT